ncbi:MAG: SMC-Scp complex subunit ScpB [Gemmataceae bacterium]|nr:SMC-Scp complex subunit ScpB [Gemmata sp.]MDW8198281.1 SMC-Scp complex subunit ScpB [Gemmataceae bacterium]
MMNSDSGSQETDPLALGRRAASQLSGAWQLDTPDISSLPEAVEALPELCPPAPPPRQAEGERPTEVAATAAAPAGEAPPSLEQIIEAMLFVGGHPLTAAVACSAIRGLTPEQFQQAIDTLNKRYRDQWRPYWIEPRHEGFVLALRPAYRPLRERLFGSPRETRLSQAALDVLAVVAYRQPVSKAEVDALRGTDSGAVLRQLVRLGLVAVQHRAEANAREVRYGTTARFLSTFGLSSLDDLPRLGDATPL